MAWSTPKTWSSGAAVTAGEMNQEVRDNLNALRAERVVGGYATGTWTPAAYGCTLQSAAGYYIRIGALVWLTAYVIWPTTTDTNWAILTGLPFAIASDGMGMIGYTNHTSAPTVSVTNAAIQFFDTSANHWTNDTFSGKTFYVMALYWASV